MVYLKKHGCVYFQLGCTRKTLSDIVRKWNLPQMRCRQPACWLGLFTLTGTELFEVVPSGRCCFCSVPTLRGTSLPNRCCWHHPGWQRHHWVMVGGGGGAVTPEYTHTQTQSSWMDALDPSIRWEPASLEDQTHLNAATKTSLGFLCFILLLDGLITAEFNSDSAALGLFP